MTIIFKDVLPLAEELFTKEELENIFMEAIELTRNEEKLESGLSPDLEL